MINLDKAALNSPHPRFESSISRAVGLHRPSTNSLGMQSRSFLYDCKTRIAGHLARDPVDISFFGSATAAVRFAAKKLKHDHVFTFHVPSSEHNCSLSVADYKLDVDSDGQVILGALPYRKAEFDVLVISLKNNETGVTPSDDVRHEIAAAQSQGVRLMLDATGGNWNDPLMKSADYIFASSGKWHGLSGLGLLVGTADLWDDQPTEGLGGLVGGSPNMIGISCLADAMDWIAGPHGSGLTEKNNHYLHMIDETATALGWSKNGSGFGVANYSTGIPSDLFLQEASESGLTISAGAACNSGISSASHVITAMFDEKRAMSSIRISWDRLTKETELIAAMEIVKNTDSVLRAVLPRGDSND